jgi:hypothetical protein
MVEFCIGLDKEMVPSIHFYYRREIMCEKIGAAFVMIVTIIAMVFFKGLELPALITIPLVVACTVIYLMGVVFLFSEGTIIKWPQRVKAASRVASREPSLESF